MRTSAQPARARRTKRPDIREKITWSALQAYVVPASAAAGYIPGSTWPSAAFDPRGHAKRLVLETCDRLGWRQRILDEVDALDGYARFVTILGAAWTAYRDATPHRPWDAFHWGETRPCGEADLGQLPANVLLTAIALLTERECDAIATWMQTGHGPWDDDNYEIVYEAVSMTGCSAAVCGKLFAMDCADDDADDEYSGKAFDVWSEAVRTHRDFVRALRQGFRSTTIAQFDPPDLVVPTRWPDFEAVIFAAYPSAAPLR